MAHYRNIDASAKVQVGVVRRITIEGGLIINASATAAWVHFWDADADDVTPGTDVPDVSIYVPTPGSTNGGGVQLHRMTFHNGITMVASTDKDGSTSNDPGTNAIIVNLELN